NLPVALYLRKHACEHLQVQVLLIPEAISPALEDPDLVVDSLDESQRYLVFRPAVGHDAFPVLLDHGRELLEGGQALPLERRLPVVEEFARPTFFVVAPKLTEGLLEEVCLGKPSIVR